MEIGSIFKNKERKKGASVTDLKILVLRLLKWNLKGLVGVLKPVEL